MVTVCLNMIVKNESKIIERLLHSVLPIIDTYCICDTGSTDDTKNIIKKFFDKVNIKGKIIEEPFKNFGYNRTFALKEAKNMADYLLFLDADMKLEIDKSFDKNKLVHDCYNINQGNKNFTYSNLRLVRTDVEVECVGYTHEYYSIKKQNHILKNLDNVRINDIGDGGCKENKFTRDKCLLEDYLKIDPNCVRTHFYLANTYLSLGNIDKSIEYYKKRIELGGWEEENFYSRYKLGKCYYSKGDHEKAIITWMEAYNYRPTRAESLYEIVKHYRITGKYYLCFQFYKIAKSIPYPKNDLLFIHKDIYDFRLDYEFSVICYYIDKNVDIRNIFFKLFNCDSMNFGNIISNYKFYSKSLDSCKISSIDIFNHNKITDLIDEKYKSFNVSTPSIIKYKDGYLANLRLVDYKIENGNYIYCNGEKGCKTKNIAIFFDNNFKFLKLHNYIPEYDSNCIINGLEDVRLFNFNGDIYYTSTKQFCDNDNLSIGVVCGKYDTCLDKLIHKKLESPNNRKCEKNWVMFKHSDKLKMIYEWFPLTIYDFDTENMLLNKDTKSEKKSPILFQHLRGSTNGFQYNNEIWFLCHLVSFEGSRNYYHIFVILDNQTLEIKRYSYPFKFCKSYNIEYTLGLIIDKNTITVSHSSNDDKGKITIYNKQKVLNNMFSL